jgi:GNAT superfamily N-acetyltransferase
MDPGQRSVDAAMQNFLGSGRKLVPHMALAPVDPPPPPPGVTVRPVTAPASKEMFRQVMTETGVPKLASARLFPDSFLDDDDVRGFVAELDGQPAGTDIAIRTGDVAGVYAVGTVESARRRGVGTAATWAVVGAARAWASSVVVLQSSAMGFGVYEAIGFRTVARFAGFTGTRAGTA